MTTAPAPAQPQGQPEPLLTAREIEVVYLLFNSEIDLSDIARKLSVTRSAINQYTVSIYSKLQVSSRFEAVCKLAQQDENYREAFVNSLINPAKAA